MGASLSDYNPLDKCSTIRAWLTGTLINLEMILKITAAIDPIYAGAVGTDAVLQGLAYGAPQVLGLKRREKT